MVKLKMKEPTMLAKSLVNTQSTLNQVKLELFIIKTIKISTMELTRNTAPKQLVSKSTYKEGKQLSSQTWYKNGKNATGRNLR